MIHTYINKKWYIVSNSIKQSSINCEKGGSCQQVVAKEIKWQLKNIHTSIGLVHFNNYISVMDELLPKPFFWSPI